MLESLHLKNVILVKDMTIDFSSGFNVITGETGAGKSLIIKSLDCLSGAVASESYIHPDEQMAFIEATFLVPESSPIPSDYLDHGRLTVSRRLYRNRPTVNKLNFESVALKELKAIMRHVMFLTTQHQVMELMDASNHLTMFDRFIGKDMVVLNAQYQLAFKDYQSLKQHADNINGQADALTHEVNELSVLVSDIDDQQFSVQEEDDLLLQQKKCEALQARREQVAKLLSISSNLTDQVHELDRALGKLNDSPGKNVHYDVMQVLDGLTQFHQDMTNERLDIEYLESVNIDDINQRLANIFQYKVKYCVNSLSELLALRDHSKEKLANIDIRKDEKEHVNQQVLAKYEVVVDLAAQLSALRVKHRPSFEYIVLNQIKQLGMVDAQFSLSFDGLDTLGTSGQDTISFMFSANPNMPLQPLKKVASGGELSRIMLALLVTNSGVMGQPLVVFDEIDVGIGGMTANHIGTLLQTMADQVQLLVVTHLPQIARCAAHHFTITKAIHEGESCVTINKLDKDHVSIELQRMVGGDVVASLIK